MELRLVREERNLFDGRREFGKKPKSPVDRTFFPPATYLGSSHADLSASLFKPPSSFLAP
jgi:hypothetical protein